MHAFTVDTSSLKDEGKYHQVAHAVEYGPNRTVEKKPQVCYCVLAYNPTNFYLITESDMIINVRFTNDMEQLYMTDAHYLDASQVSVGTPVAARYVGGDLSWYRAKIISCDNEKDEYVIEFVDYAHKQTSSLLQLRAIPANIVCYPPMALQCKLNGLDNCKSQEKDLDAAFCDLIYKKWPKGKCVASFMSDSPPYVVRLFHIETGVELLPEHLGEQYTSKILVPTTSSSAKTQLLAAECNSDTSKSEVQLDVNHVTKLAAQEECSLQQCLPEADYQNAGAIPKRPLLPRNSVTDLVDLNDLDNIFSGNAAGIKSRTSTSQNGCIVDHAQLSSDSTETLYPYRTTHLPDEQYTAVKTVKSLASSGSSSSKIGVKSALVRDAAVQGKLPIKDERINGLVNANADIPQVIRSLCPKLSKILFE